MSVVPVELAILGVRSLCGTRNTRNTIVRTMMPFSTGTGLEREEVVGQDLD